MKLIFIHGPAAAGKLTIARALSRLTGIGVFHNHLVVDTLLAAFDFGSAPFVKLREPMWLSVFEEAAVADISLIFTFAPEATVSTSFVPEAIAVVERHGGQVCFARLTLPVEEQERRVVAPARAEFKKLRSLEILRANRKTGAADYPALPDSGLIIDTSLGSPEETARRIAAHFALPVSAAMG